MDSNLDSMTTGVGLNTRSLPRNVVGSGFNNISNNPVAPIYQRITPRQVSTGMQRGEQTLSGTLQVLSSDGSQRILLGTGPDGEFGMFSCTVNNNDPSSLSVVWKRIGITDYTYDPSNSNKNVMQTGKLPSGAYGIAVARAGYNVSDGYS
jgi:hypothetical protein